MLSYTIGVRYQRRLDPPPIQVFDEIRFDSKGVWLPDAWNRIPQFQTTRNWKQKQQTTSEGIIRLTLIRHCHSVHQRVSRNKHE